MLKVKAGDLADALKPAKERAGAFLERVGLSLIRSRRLRTEMC